MRSVTQFVWSECLGMPVYKADKAGSDESCWLCGGDTDGEGHSIKSIIGAAFTDTTIARNNNSKTVCYQCAALMKKDAWVVACEKFNLPPHFPVKDDKKPFLSNWMFSSHVFSVGKWERPERNEVRSHLLNPPKPPFVMVFSLVGKKHVIFKSEINTNNDVFFVNVDENKILVDRVVFETILKEFEYAYNMGFSKDSLVTGNYNQAAAMKVGISTLREIEVLMREYRMREPDMLFLAGFCAQKYEK